MKDLGSNANVVSFDSESLILVDPHDQEIGHLSKQDCHEGEGVLHRAFSLFIFNTEGKLLLQKRAPEKRLWPGYWSNSCCSHPRAGESMPEAVVRRLEQELGIRADLQFIYKFIYQARFGTAGSENEFCWVYAGRGDETVVANSTEISDWRYLGADDVDRELDADPDSFTPWFRLEWRALRGEYRKQLTAALAGQPKS